MRDDFENFKDEMRKQMKELYLSKGCECCGDYKREGKALIKIAKLLDIDCEVDEIGLAKIKF